MGQPINRLMQYSQGDANNFGPMTAEQQMMLQRDAIQPSMGPLEMFPMTAAGASIGGGMAAIGGLRQLMSDPRKAAAVLEYLKGIGVVGGAGAGMGFAMDGMNKHREMLDEAQSDPTFPGQPPRRFFER